jgi:hypothetical protein
VLVARRFGISHRSRSSFLQFQILVVGGLKLPSIEGEHRETLVFGKTIVSPVRHEQSKAAVWVERVASASQDGRSHGKRRPITEPCGIRAGGRTGGSLAG